MLDCGACASVGRKVTLERILRVRGLSDIPNGMFSREVHRFGNHTETHRTVCAIKFPFECTDAGRGQTSTYDVTFNVIEGELPLLMGLPTLLTMRAALNFGTIQLDCTLRGR